MDDSSHTPGWGAKIFITAKKDSAHEENEENETTISFQVFQNENVVALILEYTGRLDQIIKLSHLSKSFCRGLIKTLLKRHGPGHEALLSEDQEDWSNKLFRAKCLHFNTKPYKKNQHARKTIAHVPICNGNILALRRLSYTGTLCVLDPNDMSVVVSQIDVDIDLQGNFSLDYSNGFLVVNGGDHIYKYSKVDGQHKFDTLGTWARTGRGSYNADASPTTTYVASDEASAFLVYKNEIQKYKLDTLLEDNTPLRTSQNLWSEQEDWITTRVALKAGKHLMVVRFADRRHENVLEQTFNREPFAANLGLGVYSICSESLSVVQFLPFQGSNASKDSFHSPWAGGHADYCLLGDHIHQTDMEGEPTIAAYRYTKVSMNGQTGKLKMEGPFTFADGPNTDNEGIKYMTAWSVFVEVEDQDVSKLVEFNVNADTGKPLRTLDLKINGRAEVMGSPARNELLVTQFPPNDALPYSTHTF
ncbi:MAG: hypothetical protein SGILL_007508, partial [Bacillariaceae sp.]